MSKDFPRYNIEILDSSGTTLDMIEDAISLSAARAFNTKGNATLVIPNHYQRSWFEYDTRFRIYRIGRSRKPHLFGDTVWFLRKFRNRRTERIYEVEMVDTIGILEKRVVAYTSETPYADKTLEEFGLITPNDDLRIDNMMRQYVRENMGADVLDAARTISLVDVEIDRSLAPYGEKQASWSDLEATISDLANQSAGKGMELFYDFIAMTDGTFMFRVWKDVRRIDHGTESSLPLEFDDESGALVDVVEEDDYTDYANYCYVLGYDKGPAQIVVEEFDTLRVGRNALSRVEFTSTGSDSDVDSVLESEGQAAIRGRRGRRNVTAKLSDMATLDYGEQFAYGDKVIARIGGFRYDVHLDAVATNWSAGVENLDLRLNGSTDL